MGSPSGRISGPSDDIFNLYLKLEKKVNTKKFDLARITAKVTTINIRNVTTY